jgi:DNA-binding transcriptional ArsR family regulator
MRQYEYTDKLLGLIGSRFNAIAHPLRLKIILVLKEEPTCVCELAERLGERQPLVSQHLSILKDSGLVTTKRMGNKIQYSLNDERIADIIEIMREITLERVKELSKIQGG